MRRVALLVLAGLAGVAGFVQIAAPPPPAPEFESSHTGESDAAAANATVWYCPWVEAGDVLDSTVVVATIGDASVDMTLLDPLTNAEPTKFSFDLMGPGATGIDTGNLLRRGESPAIIEFSDGPASAISMQIADGLVSADRCVVSIPKKWYLTGGSTKTGTFTEIRLFNPFADNAEVSITTHSEFDLDLSPDLDSIDVAGRAWTTIDLEPFFPFRDELVFEIVAQQGLVIPVLIRTDEHGEAMWTGTSAAQTWEFPVVSAGGLEPSLAIMSAGDDAISISIDIITEMGTTVAAREVVVDSTAPVLVPLGDLAAAPFGARVTASAPVVATVVATVPDDAESGGEGELPGDATTTTSDSIDTTDTTAVVDEVFLRGLAGTVGSSLTATSWIVPLNTIAGSETTLWMMNGGNDDATVTVLPLGESEFLVEDSVQIPAGTIVGLPIDVGIGTFGYEVVSDIPITVAWEIVGDRGVALVSGIASE